MNNGDQPAHPTLLYNEISGAPNGHRQGLTKREYFAAMAMQAVITSYMDKPVQLDQYKEPATNAAQWAVLFADELLKTLETK